MDHSGEKERLPGFADLPAAGKREAERQWAELANVFSDPLIVYPSGWELPESVKALVTPQRMARLVRSLTKEPDALDFATDAEVALYIYTVVMVEPVDEDWTQIYLYTCTRLFPDKVTGDIKVTELTPGQQQDRGRLRRWIVDQQRKQRAKKPRLSPQLAQMSKPESEAPDIPQRAPDVQQAMFAELAPSGAGKDGAHERNHKAR